MEWWVIYYNFNKRAIEQYNCLAGREDDIRKMQKKADGDIEVFKELLKREMMYRYWSKAEWEVIVSSWPPSNDHKEEYKLDVWTQIYMNWDKFVDYCWTCKIPAKKKDSIHLENQRPMIWY